jgi:hypothetical protein
LTPVLSPLSGHIPTSTTSATPITSIAKQGPNQLTQLVRSLLELSLKQPQNKAGAFQHVIDSAFLPTSPEYVLSTLEKVVNWACQGSLWPMTFGTLPRPHVFRTVLIFDLRVGLLCCGDDAYGGRTLLSGPPWSRFSSQPSPSWHHLDVTSHSN